jgi:mono/diheme cytochrome c family protein
LRLALDDGRVLVMNVDDADSGAGLLNDARTATRPSGLAHRDRRAMSVVCLAYRLLVAISLLATPASGQTEQKLSPLAEAGREEFNTYCVPCHGRSGIGDGVAAQALKKPPADLTRIAARRGGKFPDDEIAAVIDGRSDVVAHGTRDMPIWGERFTDDTADPGDAESVTQGRVALLIAYLKGIQVDVPAQPKGAPPK